MSLTAVDDYAGILREARPLIDVRSPVEFRRGALPGAVNLPLLTDDERAAVGRMYKAAGRKAAVALGRELVAEGAKAARVAAWRDFAVGHPEALLVCWRGGLRSEIAQAWLAAAGIVLPRVAGGFKALRHVCLQAIQTAAASRRFVLVGGRTGSGKTEVVRNARVHIDLEAIANHRGSAFGGLPIPQPAPVTFENALAAAFLQLSADEPVVVEDESRTIGRLAVPAALYNAMQDAPIVLLDVDAADRVANIYREYVLRAAAPEAHLATALSRIERRLGGVRYRELAALMRTAFTAEACRRREAHCQWIRRLLAYYYDPMYDYQLAGKKNRIVMRGNRREAAAYLQTLR